MNCVGAKKRSHSAIDRELLTMSRIQFDFLGLFSDGTLYLRLWTIDKKAINITQQKLKTLNIQQCVMNCLSLVMTKIITTPQLLGQ